MTELSLPTEQLLVRAQDGDGEAIEALCARYLPRLRRWAAGRLPPGARDLADTHDLVQDTLLEAFKRLESFEIRGEGAFIAYLRRALLNRITNEIRRVSRHPVPAAIVDERADSAPSPLDLMIDGEAVERYERALQALSESDRTAIIARIELKCEYDEVAAMLQKPSPAAARQAVSRAVRRLAELLQRGC
jgi:RNA polymerase sigma-70 factor (ECF subfamily)